VAEVQSAGVAKKPLHLRSSSCNYLQALGNRCHCPMKACHARRHIQVVEQTMSRMAGKTTGFL